MRFLKQLLYGIFYLALWALFIFVIYLLFRPAASCVDKVQNQGETGVDCGGPCATACVPATVKPLAQEGTALILPIDATHVSILATIANPNQDEAAKAFGYAITLLGPDGTTTIAAFNGTSYAYAGEVKYLAFPNVPVSALPAHATLALGEPQWVPFSQYEKPNLAIQNFTTIISGTGQMEVDGTIVNHDITTFPEVEIVAVFYNGSGSPIGVSETKLNNFGLNASQQFTVLHPSVSGADLSTTKVFVYAARP